MTFANIPAGTSLFVDANVLIHHFGWDPILQPPCQELLERIARQELNGFTTGHVQSTGLLTSDALIAAVMQANGLTNLASTDRDFDRLQGIVPYEPV